MRLRPELALIVALGACAPATVAPPAPLPVPQLDEPAIATLAALLAMQDRRVLDETVMAAALAHPQAAVRVQAALAGGRIGDVAAAAALRAALADADVEVAAAAAFALGELGDSSRATVDALAAAAAAAGWPRAAAAAEAVHALGKIRPSGGAAVFWPALTGGAPPAVLQEALLAVWRLPRSAEAVEAVRSHLAAPDAETRWRAAYALMRMGSPVATTALRAALADPDPRVRVNAARGLSAANADSAGERAVVQAALRAAVADTHPHVVIQAARTLAGYRDAADVGLLAALLPAGDANVAMAAAGALGELGSATARGALLAVVNGQDRPLSLRAAALAALARVAMPDALPLIEAWADAPLWLQRSYAARALGGAPWPAAAAPLASLVRDDDPRVVAEALTGAAEAPDTAALPYRWFVESLAAGDVMVRAAAARGLARAPRAQDLPLLLQAYERTAADSLTDAAVATVEALGSLRDAGVPAERSFFVRFDRARDAIVRRAVAARLGSDWGPVAPVESDRGTDEYAHAVRTLLAPALAGVLPRVRIATERGDIILELAAADAPLTVSNFLTLIRSGYYASAPLRWHRVVPNFVLQDGDPRGDGNGGPAHAIRDEMNRIRYGRGTLGMALSGPDTGGSQFFLTHSPQPHLDGGYTVFGRVVEGMDVADAIVQDDAILRIEVLP